jgi:hypothetical protein
MPFHGIHGHGRRVLELELAVAEGAPAELVLAVEGEPLDPVVAGIGDEDVLAGDGDAPAAPRTVRPHCPASRTRRRRRSG